MAGNRLSTWRCPITLSYVGTTVRGGGRENNAMSSYKTPFLVILALTALGLSALAWKQHLELIELRTAALDNGSRADWQKRVWASQKRAKDLVSRLAGTPQSGSAATAPLPASSPAPMTPIGGMMTSFASLMDRPEMAQLMAIQQKGQIDARFAALFKKLGLPPDKLAQLKALLADKLSAPIDVLSAAGPQGVDPMRNPQEFSKLIQDTQSELDEKIKSLLAPAGFAQYQNYVQTEPQRAVVSQLQQSLSYSDTQISPAQADQLVQILADTATNRAGGASSFAASAAVIVMAPGSQGPVPRSIDGNGPRGAGPITDEAIARAQSVLSAPQVQALQEIQQQQQAAAQLRQLLFQNAGAGLRGSAPLPGSNSPAAPTPGRP
jgi:hypothetical protein